MRTAVVIGTHAYSGPAMGEGVLVAHSLAKTGQFANPYNVATGLTAHLAPVYPYLLSKILILTGSEANFKIAITAWAALLSALLWALLPVAARMLHLPVQAGAIGGLLGALDPLPHWVELDGAWDADLAALIAMLLCVATLAWIPKLSGPGAAFGLGCGWGALVLIQPSCLTIFGVLIVAKIASVWSKRAWLPMTAALLGFTLVLLPWTIRNRQQIGGWFFVRDNLGLELSVSNHDGAKPLLRENLYVDGASGHPDSNRQEAMTMAGMGELAYYRQRQRQAREWIGAHPAEFLKLTAERALYFWIPPRASLPLTGFEVVLTVLALSGLARLLLDSRKIGVAFACIWLIYPLVYYTIQAEERYRYPIQWTLLLCVGIAIHTRMRRLRAA